MEIELLAVWWPTALVLLDGVPNGESALVELSSNW